MITQITYERVFNLGSYESERISATCSVEDGDVEAAYDEARMAVSEQHASTMASREAAPPAEPAPNGGATYAEPPASSNQWNFINSLVRKIGWGHEQFTAWVSDEIHLDPESLSRSQASMLIDLLRVKPPAAAPAVKPGVVEEVDLPF